jgi:hypothetical protein
MLNIGLPDCLNAVSYIMWQPIVMKRSQNFSLHIDYKVFQQKIRKYNIAILFCF